MDPATIALVRVGLQAAISADGDQLTLTDTLPGWPELGARHRIADALGIEVVLDNDVNLAAVAERAVGTGAGVDSFALLWMSDGLGVAVDPRRGSCTAAPRGVRVRSATFPVPRDAELESTDEDLTDLVGRGAFERLGGPDALEGFARRVALVAEPVLAVLDPELIVLGGPDRHLRWPAAGRTVER